MDDSVSRNMKAEIRRLAALRLGRRLTAGEMERVSKPRGYIGLEAIIDYLRDETLDSQAAARYLEQI